MPKHDDLKVSSKLIKFAYKFKIFSFVFSLNYWESSTLVLNLHITLISRILFTLSTFLISLAITFPTLFRSFSILTTSYISVTNLPTSIFTLLTSCLSHHNLFSHILSTNKSYSFICIYMFLSAIINKTYFSLLIL